MKKDTSTPVFAKPVLPAVLKLTVKKEWFDLIKSGEKNRRISRNKTLLCRKIDSNFKKKKIIPALKRAIIYLCVKINFPTIGVVTNTKLDLCIVFLKNLLTLNLKMVILKTLLLLLLNVKVFR